MAKWTRESVEALLYEKIKDELARLKKHKFKMTPYSIAHTIADFVLAMMTDSRHKEILRLRHFESQDQHFNLESYLEERERALGSMSKALQNFADGREHARLGK